MWKWKLKWSAENQSRHNLGKFTLIYLLLPATDAVPEVHALLSAIYYYYYYCSSESSDRFVTHTNGSWGGQVFTAVCLSVCLSVFLYDISNTPMQLRSPNLTYHDVPRWVLETHLFWVQKVTSHKKQWSLHLCMLIVSSCSRCADASV